MYHFLVTKACEAINNEEVIPQVKGVHLFLAASEEVDGGEAQYEQPDDVPPRLGPTPERALEGLCNVARVEQIAQLVRSRQSPEEGYKLIDNFSVAVFITGC